MTPVGELNKQTEPCLIIAEIGINHNGSLDIARQLIDMAKAAGSDAVKFQKRTIDVVYTPEVLAQPRESPWGTTTREQKMGLELSQSDYESIDAHCREIGIPWFASAWDAPSLDFLRQFKCKYNKVASAMATHLGFVEAVAEERKLTLLSTGMCTYEDIDRAVAIFRRHECPVVLMHCVSTYPTSDEECNIAMVRKLGDRYGLPVGYSGHEVGILPSVLARMLGAVAIERHITLDRAMYGSDQAASLEKRGLELLIRDIRAIEPILGNGEKVVLPAEATVARKLRYFQPA